MYVHVHLLLSMISSIKLLPSFVWTNDPLRRRRLGGWAGSLHECHLQKASENFENQGGDDDDDDDESDDEVGCTLLGYVRREVQMRNWEWLSR